MPTLNLTAYKPISGTLGDAGQVASGFTAIETVVNAIDNTNFGAGLIFDPNKIMQKGATLGQALVWDGAKFGPASVAVPIAVLMDYTVTGSPVASIDTNTVLGGNIPQTYKHLMIEISAFGTTAATRTSHGMVFNNDSGANYYAVQLTANNSAVSADKNLGVTNADLGTLTAAAGTAGVFTPCTVKIPDYTAAAKKAGYTAFGYAEADNTAAAMAFSARGGQYIVAGAITRIKFAAAAGNYDIGSRFTILGVG